MKIESNIKIMINKTATDWGICQFNMKARRIECDENQLANQRLDNINLCFNRRYVFKSPLLIDGLGEIGT